jgi:PAS domain S-box-containing protein
MEFEAPVKILIVDDKPGNLVVLEAILQTSDRILVRASSGLEAIRIVEAEKEPFGTIVLDVQMPDLDGYETAQRIKRLPQGKDVPIIFVTAIYKEDAYVQKGYAAGGLDYFSKPLNPDLLRTKVQIYTDLYRMTRRSDQHERLVAALRERLAAEKALDKLLQTVSEGVIIVDSEANITRTNEEAKWIWGGSKARPLLGKEDFVGWWVANGKSVQPEEWAMYKALKTGRVHMNEPIAIQCFDGRSKIILESASPLTDETGRSIGAVVVMKTISEETLQEVRKGA